MNSITRKGRGLGLCSGGLDSTLAGLVLKSQGIEVEWISFETPFFSSEKAMKASRLTGIPLTVKRITDEYLQLLENPPGGFGKNMNPCMDCHALMFRLAGEEMKKKGFDFLFSGEVLGQRPMSQTRTSLRYVEKHSGFDGYILRPLSAKRLPETVPEKEGFVNRELLLDLAGRSRKPQIALAKEFGFSDYPAPSGGCLLTDKNFSIRLKELFDKQKEYSDADFELLKYGRHFRLDDTTKMIVGRDEKDNESILNLYDSEKDVMVTMEERPSPIILIPGGGNFSQVRLAASICIGYSKNIPVDPIQVSATTPDGKEFIQTMGIDAKQIKHMII
ncbi:MAG: tRNA 4-thiouridine(8) synthase ThiI [Desulfobacterales bacterium]|nr:tRNA 4-thiouridine(8) synthase ThiI [Desulfobacterales bacterium]